MIGMHNKSPGALYAGCVKTFSTGRYQQWRLCVPIIRFHMAHNLWPKLNCNNINTPHSTSVTCHRLQPRIRLTGSTEIMLLQFVNCNSTVPIFVDKSVVRLKPRSVTIIIAFSYFQAIKSRPIHISLQVGYTYHLQSGVVMFPVAFVCTGWPKNGTIFVRLNFTAKY